MPRVLVVLVRGKGPRPKDFRKLENNVKALTKMNVRIFVVAIGNDMDKQQLRLLVSRDRDLLDLKSFSALANYGENITNLACENPGMNSLGKVLV